MTCPLQLTNPNCGVLCSKTCFQDSEGDWAIFRIVDTPKQVKGGKVTGRRTRWGESLYSSRTVLPSRFEHDFKVLDPDEIDNIGEVVADINTAKYAITTKVKITQEASINYLKNLLSPSELAINAQQTMEERSTQLMSPDEWAISRQQEKAERRLYENHGSL